MKRIADLDERTQAVVKAALAAEKLTTQSKWINADEAQVILGAIDSNEKTVTLYGKVYDILPRGTDTWFIRPADKRYFVPCGYYTKHLLNSIILSAQEAR